MKWGAWVLSGFKCGKGIQWHDMVPLGPLLLLTQRPLWKDKGSNGIVFECSGCL